MARIFTWTGRGGDLGQTLLLKQFPGSRVSSTVPRMAYDPSMGGWCLDIGYTSACATVPLAPAKSEIYVSFIVKRTTHYQSSLMLEFMLGSTYLGTLMTTGGGTSGNQFPTLSVYSGHNSVGLVSGGRIDANTDYVFHIEVYYKPAASGGRWIVKLNGRTVIDFTGDTVPGTESTLDKVCFGAGGFTNNVYFYYNDIVIDDANWPGMCKMAQLSPAGAGNYAQWVPSVSPNWDCVDECPPAATEFNKSNSVDDSDSFVAADLPGGAVVVNGVSVWIWGMKENAPTPTQIKPLVRTSSTDYLGSGVTPEIYHTFISGFWAVNPYTSQPWTPTEVNNTEIGVKSAV